MFSLLLSLSLFLVVTCGASAETPAPLWTQTVALKSTQMPGQTAGGTIEAVTPESLVIAVGTGSLLALDTQTGKTLWQREGHWQGTNARNADVGKGDSWNLIGTARGEGAATVCLLKHIEQEITLDSVPATSGVFNHLRSARYTLEAVLARTGQPLWQSPAYSDKPEPHFTLRHGILIITTAGGGSTVRREYQDVLTSKPLALDTTEGHAQARQILARNGGSILVNEGTFHEGGNTPLPDWPLLWLRADTGTVETLPLPKERGYIHADLVEPLTSQGRMVLRIDMDDDFVGHSQFPKYLVGCDMQGRKLWQFPTKIDWKIGYNALTQVGVPMIIPGTGICLVDGYGLRVGDGKPLWKQTPALAKVTGRLLFNGAATRSAAVYKAGCFALNSDFHPVRPTTVSVAYVAAQTGAVRPVLFGLHGDQIRVIGETLLVQTSPDSFRAYSIPALLATGQKQSGVPRSSGDVQQAALLRRLVADYPYIVWNGSRRMALRERQGTGQSAPYVAFLSRDEDAWLTRNAQQDLKWDIQRAYAIMPDGVTVWDRKTGKAIWNRRAARPGNVGPTVVVSEGRVVMDDPQGVLHCLEGATGQQLWRLVYDPVNPAPKALSAYTGNGQTRYLPLAILSGRVYLTTTGSAADNYHIVEVDAATGRILRQAQPQPSDDLAFYLTSIAGLPDEQGFYAMQQEVGVGREFFTLLVLNQHLKTAWKRRVQGFQLAGERFVCAVGKPLGKQQQGVSDPDNLTGPSGRESGTIFVGLDRMGHERWRRALSADALPIGSWKGSVLALHSNNAARSPYVGNTRHYLSGIRPVDGKVLWTVRLPSAPTRLETSREAKISEGKKR